MSQNKGYAVTLGTFDGLHKGHISVLNAALGFEGLTPIAVTFNEPPKRSAGAFVPMLMSVERKNRLLREMGFSEVIVLDYSKICNLSPSEFLGRLFEKYNVKAAVCGFNYRFGKDRKGDVAFLSSYCHERGAEAVICPAMSVSGQTVSSSLIRELIADGKVALANMMLGYPFSIEGEVIHGDSRGRTIGFPTVNQQLDSNIVIPAYGVYSSVVTACGKEYAAVTNIGIRPTFILTKPLSETHIIGFSGDLYGRIVSVKLLNFLRPEKLFENLNALKEAIAEDTDLSSKDFSLYCHGFDK